MSTPGRPRPGPGPPGPAPAPAPARTLRQPLALNVTERTTTPSAAPAAAAKSDAAVLRSALQRRAQLARRADRWTDRAMEEVLDRDTFQRALSYMHAAQYAEVTHERHLNSLCGYPLCGNAPRAAYRSAKRFVVSTARRTITETEGNAEDGFCSRRCAARSAWVAASLGTEAAWIRGKVAPLELLEDREARGEVSWGGRRGDVLVWNKKEEAEAKPEPEPEPALPVKAPISVSPAAAGVPPGGLTDLIASLSVVERATPAAKPLPPNRGGTVEQGAVLGPASLPLPLPQGGVLARSKPTGNHDAAPNSTSAATASPSSPASAARRAGSSLLGSTKLATTVLNASKNIAVPEEESDGSASEEEWAKSMGWGSGPEVDALFAEAAQARQLMEP